MTMKQVIFNYLWNLLLSGRGVLMPAMTISESARMHHPDARDAVSVGDLSHGENNTKESPQLIMEMYQTNGMK